MSETDTIDVRDMAIVHKTFRATFDESAALVESEPNATAERVAFLADHIDFSLTLLQLHHEGEDELLWPLLIERVPAEAAMVQRVADQHHDVSAGMDRARSANNAWRAQPTEVNGKELAASLSDLSRVLCNHLDDEERLVVPLAAKTMTQDEWQGLGKHAQAAIPQDRMFIAFGMLLDRLTDDERAFLMGGVPEPVQQLWQTVGQPTWQSYADELRGA